MRFKVFLLSVFAAVTVCAQTQRGLVRTIGTATHHGVPVADATIKVKGNNQPYRSDSKGVFSLAMHQANAGDKFQLLNVTKRGYELADKNFLSRTFAYSSQSVLEIVMLSSEEMAKEKQTIEKRVLNTAKKNYEHKLNVLKQEQEQGLITIEDYRSKLKALQDQYDTFDEILSAMAEHYARTDYDCLDSLDVLINTHIINGELDEADILLAQKGSLDDRIATYQRHAATNEAAREMLDKLTDELREQRLTYEKERDDIANDLYNKHSIAISRFDFDEALKMLKLRADLDTTNVGASWDYAVFCYDQKKFGDSEMYWQTCLKACISQNDIDNLAATQNNLGNLYLALHDYANSEKYLKQSLENREQLFQQDPDTYRAELANPQDNLGNLYLALHDYANSEKYYKLALENREQLFQQNPDAYRANLAVTQNNLGNLYLALHDYANSEKYYKLALENREQLFKQNPDTYREDLASTQNNLGTMYAELNDYANSEKFFKLGLENYEQLFQQTPDAYRAYLAKTQNNLGALYGILHNYASCEKYYKLALENRELLYMQNPDAYRDDLANTQNTLGILYRALNDYPNSEKFYKLALENYEQLSEQNSDAYRVDLASMQNNLGALYTDLHDYANSEKYYKQALEGLEQLFKQNPDAYRTSLTHAQNNLGILYAYLHDYANSEKYNKQALENLEQLFKQNPDAYRAPLADTQHNLGALYADLHDYANSEKYYKLALENKEQLYQQNPDAYRADLASTQNNLGILYAYLDDYTNCEKYYKLALENKEQLYQQNPDAYRPPLAMTHWNMMPLYKKMGNIDQYEIHLQKALELYTELYASQPDLFKERIIILRNRKVFRMLENDRIDEAMALAEETLTMDEDYEMSKTCLSACHNSKAYEYAEAGDFVNALMHIDKTIALVPDDPDYYDTKGEILLLQGRNDEALAMWQKVLELNPNFLDDNPDGTALSNGLKKLGLIE